MRQYDERSFFVFPSSAAEIEILINSFKVGKSVGPYSIPIKLLKILCSYISQPFSEIVDKSFKGLNKFVELSDVLYSLQFGFREKYSTNHALISVNEAIKSTIDNKTFGCEVLSI